MPKTQPRAFEALIERIRADIATGKLRPGQRLPPERRVAAQLRVGRGSMREAVRILELLGLVEVKRGRGGGVVTTPNCQEVARASLTSLLRLQDHSVLDSVEFRRIVEPKAAALAAARATDDHLEMLQKTIVMMEDGAAPDVFVENNYLFHKTIALATGNPYIQTFFPQFLLMRETSFSAAHTEQVQRSLTTFFHRKILEAIRERSAAEAEAWMEEHLSQIERDFARARELAGTAPPDRIPPASPPHHDGG